MQRYYRWVADVRMDYPVQQIVLEEYRDAVRQAEERVKDLDEEMRKAPVTWSQALGTVNKFRDRGSTTARGRLHHCGGERPSKAPR
jgi:hypothetical protein